MPGMFKTGMQTGKQMFYRQIEHGVTILATGALPNRPDSYLLDERAAVSTQLDCRRLIEDRPEAVKAWDNVVMIQCVGSRTAGQSQLFADLLPDRREKRPADSGTQPGSPDLRPLSGYADLRLSGGILPEGPGAWASSLSAMNQDNPPQVEAAGAMVEVTFNDPDPGPTGSPSPPTASASAPAWWPMRTPTKIWR